MIRTFTGSRLLAALCMSVVAGIAGSAPATADTGQKADKVGDAPAIVDIAGFTVHNDDNRVVITAAVPGLKTRGGFAFSYSTSRNGGLIVFARKVAGELQVEATYCGEVACHDVRCAGLLVRWQTEKHRLRAVVPQRCHPAPLPSPGVFNVTSASRSDYDDAGVLRVARG